MQEALLIFESPKIDLREQGASNFEIDRFRRLFRHVWRAIPVAQQDCIYEKWNQKVLHPYPWIELSNWVDPGVMAQIIGQGREFKVSLNEFRKAPDEVVQFFLAHELAHIFQASQGIRPSSREDAIFMPGLFVEYEDANSFPWGNTEEHEADADRIARSWGFSKQAKIRWLSALRLNDQKPGDTLWTVEFAARYLGVVSVFAHHEEDAKARAKSLRIDDIRECLDGVEEMTMLAVYNDDESKSDLVLGAFDNTSNTARIEGLEPPIAAPWLQPDRHFITRSTDGSVELSDELARVLVTERSHYRWPKKATPQESQHRIIILEDKAARALQKDSTDAIWQTVCDVSQWGGNRAPSQRKLENMPEEEREELAKAVRQLADSKSIEKGLGSLCSTGGLSLVMTSKIFRFFHPEIGAAVDRHSSYFFNSLRVEAEDGLGHATHFLREWTDAKHCTSRLAIYSHSCQQENLRAYLYEYLPLLSAIAAELTRQQASYECAATGKLVTSWRPCDIDMAAFQWWGQHGLK